MLVPSVVRPCTKVHVVVSALRSHLEIRCCLCAIYCIIPFLLFALAAESIVAQDNAPELELLPQSPPPDFGVARVNEDRSLTFWIASFYPVERTRSFKVRVPFVVEGKRQERIEDRTQTYTVLEQQIEVYDVPSQSYVLRTASGENLARDVQESLSRGAKRVLIVDAANLDVAYAKVVRADAIVVAISRPMDVIRANNSDVPTNSKPIGSESDEPAPEAPEPVDIEGT